MINPASTNQSSKYQQGRIPLSQLSNKCLNKQHPDFTRVGFIEYRSSYEKKFIEYLENNPNVDVWGIEVVVIPYIGPDLKKHQYYIDFYMKSTKEGKEYLIEIKPGNQTSPETIKKTKSVRSKVYQIKELAKNQRKWSAAIEYARNRGMEFKILTETTINKLK